MATELTGNRTYSTQVSFLIGIGMWLISFLEGFWLKMFKWIIDIKFFR